MRTAFLPIQLLPLPEALHDELQDLARSRCLAGDSITAIAEAVDRRAAEDGLRLVDPEAWVRNVLNYPWRPDETDGRPWEMRL